MTTRLALTAVALVLGGTASPPALAQQLRAADAAELLRLPPVDTTPAHPTLDDRDVVVHAAGALTFRLPFDWQLREVPVGREIRLVLSPQPIPADPENLTDGLWIAYRRSTMPSPDPATEIDAAIGDRLSLATSARAIPTSDPQRFLLSDFPAVRMTFTLPADAPATSSRGHHLLARTPWGIIELHSVATEASAAHILPTTDDLLAQLRLAPPVIEDLTVAPGFESAAPALGTWKAIRSRMRINGDGTIAINFDRDGIFDLAGSGRLRYDQRRTVLRGTYTAAGDLIKVTFTDGTRLNYRYRVQGDYLLLTDHHGRTSQLARLFD